MVTQGISGAWYHAGKNREGGWIVSAGCLVPDTGLRAEWTTGKKFPERIYTETGSLNVGVKIFGH